MAFEQPVYDDPFRPRLGPPWENQPTFELTEFQKYQIRRILEYACSDSRFVDKAYAGITFILSGPRDDVIPPEPLHSPLQLRQLLIPPQE